MAEDTKSWDLNQVAVNFLAVDLGSGYGDGAAIKIEPSKPQNTWKEGADGSAATAATNSALFKVTLTFLSTSSANAKLSAILTTMKALGNSAGIGPFFLKDLRGLTQFASPKAQIEGWPPLEMSAEPTNVEWVIMCAEGVPFWGGN